MKDNNSSKKNKLFGRNIFTLFILIPILFVVIFCIFIIVNYVSVYNSNKLEAFKDKNIEEQYDSSSYNQEPTRMKGSQFDEYGIIFKCVEYNEDKKTANYELRVYKNENSKDLSKNITANVCLTADWIGFVSYATKTTSLRLADDKSTAEGSVTYRKTFSISNIVDFPQKADTWPVKVTVNEPNIYLYLEFTYQENGKAKTDAYVLEYSYQDLLPESGGIRK